MGAGNWPWILKLGHNLAGFLIFGLVLCHVTLKSAETSFVKRRPSVPHGANLFLFDCLDYEEHDLTSAVVMPYIQCASWQGAETSVLHLIKLHEQWLISSRPGGGLA